MVCKTLHGPAWFCIQLQTPVLIPLLSKLKFLSSSMQKSQTFSGCSFSNVRNCCILFLYGSKLNIFRFWTVGLKKQDIWRIGVILKIKWFIRPIMGRVKGKEIDLNLILGLESSTLTDCTHIHALAHSMYGEPNAYWPVWSSPFQLKADQWS